MAGKRKEKRGKENALPLNATGEGSVAEGVLPPAPPLLRGSAGLHSTPLPSSWVQAPSLTAPRTRLWSHEGGSPSSGLHPPAEHLCGPIGSQGCASQTGIRLPATGDGSGGWAGLGESSPLFSDTSVPGGSPSCSHLSGKRMSLTTGCSCTPWSILKFSNSPWGAQAPAGRRPLVTPGGWPAWHRADQPLCSEARRLARLGARVGAASDPLSSLPCG